MNLVKENLDNKKLLNIVGSFINKTSFFMVKLDFFIYLWYNMPTMNEKGNEI